MRLHIMQYCLYYREPYIAIHFYIVSFSTIHYYKVLNIAIWSYSVL